MSKTSFNHNIWTKPLNPNKVYYYTMESGSKLLKDYIIGLRAKKILRILKKI